MVLQFLGDSKKPKIQDAETNENTSLHSPKVENECSFYEMAVDDEEEEIIRTPAKVSSSLF